MKNTISFFLLLFLFLFVKIFGEEDFHEKKKPKLGRKKEKGEKMKIFPCFSISKKIHSL